MLVFMFLNTRKRQKQMKEQQEEKATKTVPGVKVLLQGGLYGTVVSYDPIDLDKPAQIEIAPGVRMVRVGGHTPGQSIVLVDTADGTVALASDAVHYYEEYEDDYPFAFVADLPGMYAGFDLLRELERNGQIQHIVPGHDPATLDRFGVIADGPLPGLTARIGNTK